MDTYWVPGVNAAAAYGRWAFAEFRDVYMISHDFGSKVEEQFGDIIDVAVLSSRASSEVEA